MSKKMLKRMKFLKKEWDKPAELFGTACVPKSWAQCVGEPTITRKWMENYCCDQVRYLARSFAVPGDHAGQSSTGVRMPVDVWPAWSPGMPNERAR